MGSQADEEFVMAFDIRDGNKLWSTKVGAVGANDGPQYPGPRSTPTAEADAVYTLGSDGDLVGVEAATGKMRWHLNLGKDFEGRRDVWAYAESPLIDGDVLICTPGGDKATMVSLHKQDGSVIWKAQVPTGNFAGYASPIVAQVGNIKQYVQFLGGGVVGIAARDGRFLWRYHRNVGGQNCATPIVHDGYVFTSASGMGSAGGDALLRLTAQGDEVEAKEVYRLRGMTNHHGGVIRIGDYLYGTGGAALVCLEFKTGKVVWKERGVGKGSIMAADGHLYVRGQNGAVALVEATPEGYKETGRLQQPDRSRFPTFPHPVVAGGRLYLRDEDALFCYDIKE
jgi:outer membrane protein assembly factor BamB